MLIGHALAYAHADGTIQFADLNFNIPEGRSALVGDNGVGKSVLARLLSGQLLPSAGRLKRNGRISYLAQLDEDSSTQTVGEYLMSLWDAPAERQTKISALLQDLPMERLVEQLSGGEKMRVRIAHALLQTWDLLILDEPSNNLDSRTRALLADLLSSADFSFLLISHDRRLLRLVDRIFELSSQGLHLYGGNFDFYETQKRLEATCARETLRSARTQRVRLERERQLKLQRQQQRTRNVEKKAPSLGLPKILLGGRKRAAQRTAGKLKRREDRSVERGQQGLSRTIQAQKRERLLYFQLPETAFPRGKQLLRIENANFHFHGAPSWLWRQDLNLTLSGPARLAIQGENGSGKSTLLHLLLGRGAAGRIKGRFNLSGGARVFLDQNYSTLTPSLSVLDNVQPSSRFDEVETRNHLARFLFQNEQVHQKAESLSGGERMRACLAKALLASEPPQILLLDEPTNNLDLAGIAFLESLLRAYQGAVLAVSHDADFLAAIECRTRLTLT